MFTPGDRVLVARQRATVRYVGPVDGADGLWVGVEWDDPTRGRHDGAVADRRYFVCTSSSSTGGSLVRASKVAAGNGLVDALKQRYTNKVAERSGGIAAAGDSPDASDAAAVKARAGRLWVQLVGEDEVSARLSRTDLLVAARVVTADVSHAVRAMKSLYKASAALMPAPLQSPSPCGARPPPPPPAPSPSAV